MVEHVEEVQLNPTLGIAVRATIPMAELPEFFAAAYDELGKVVGESGAQPSGPPLARYHSVPPAPVDVEAVMPVDRSVAPSGRVQPVELPGGSALQVRHFGPYDSMGAAYAEIERWMSEHHLEPADAPREVYLTNPMSTPDPARWLTLIIQPTRPV